MNYNSKSNLHTLVIVIVSPTHEEMSCFHAKKSVHMKAILKVFYLQQSRHYSYPCMYICTYIHTYKSQEKLRKFNSPTRFSALYLLCTCK